MRILPISLALVLGGACNSPTAPSGVDLGEPFTLAPGDRARTDGPNLTILFNQVTSDSRCPINSYCVWAGDAVVNVTLSQPGRKPSTVELHTSARFARQVTYGGLTVTLVGLAPPTEGPPIPQDAYRATFVVR